MFVQPRHDLDEVARPRAVIELGRENAVPRVAAGARRSRQAEDEGGAGDTSGGAALDGRGADLGMAQHVERDRETVHQLLEQRLDRLRRHVAPGKTGTARGDDDIDARIRNPFPDDATDRLDVVGCDLARRETMTGRGEPVRKRGSGLVIRERAMILASG